MALLMALLFFISGATALVGEVIWMRMLGLVLGNTVWAASAAVAVWMAGIAIGSRLGAVLAPRTACHLRWYGVVEGVIGLFYVLSPAAHSLLLRTGALLGPDLSRSLALALAQRLALSAAALLLPTILMGLTLPLLVERLHGTALARRVSLLYGVNTAGAASGVLIAAYLALPLLGERGALAAASLACAAVAVVAVLSEGRVPAAPAATVAAATTRSSRSYLLLVAAMGLSALAAELVWVRILVLHLGSRVYAFAVLLGVYLIGIGTGSLVVWVLAGRITDPRRALARVQLATGATLACQLLALARAGDLMVWLSELATLRITFAAAQTVSLLAVAILFLPVTVLFGASFPLAVAADPARRSAGAHAGMISAANTVGAIAGALGAPFLLVPLIGCQRTLLLLVLIHLAVALGLRSTRTAIAAVLLVTAVTAGLWWRLPADWVLRRGETTSDEGTELISLKESLGATVLVKRHHEAAGTWLSLELNGVNVAGSAPALLAVQQLQGHLPLLQHPSPRRVLHVGFGSGGTCWAVSRYRQVEEIDVVEISPDVLDAADTYFPFINHHVLEDSRVRVVLNDGRNYLLATDRTYDVILSDSIHPVFAGNSTLYTLEYFRLCREHLDPGGVVSMWLPLYSLDQQSYLRILAAFHQVFPTTFVWYDITTVNEFSVVTGRVEPGQLSISWQQLADQRVAASLAIAGVRSPADLLADLLLTPDDVHRLVQDVPPHQDDLPFVEYVAGRTMFRQLTWYQNLYLIASGRGSSLPIAGPPGPLAQAVERRDRTVEEHLQLLRGSLAE